MSLPAPPDASEVQVRLFGALRERAGWGARPIRLGSAGGTAADLWRQLALGEAHGPEACADAGPDACPEAAQRSSSLPAGIRVAINLSFADPGTPLRPGDEVAFLPPITGG